MIVEFPHERWFSPEQFDGYGSIAVVPHAGKDCLALKPKTSCRAAETHAALMTSLATYEDFEATFEDVTTIEQLRTCAAPNPWERAWVIWHFTDVRHFYYFILKDNGWELGKRDPAYPGGQRFLATGERPHFPVGRLNTVRIEQAGATIMVTVDAENITTHVEARDIGVHRSAGVYRSGRFGFYSEDAHVRFGRFSVEDRSDAVTK